MYENCININIDMLRILAAAMVMLVHIGQCVGINLDFGAYGVKLFFIISGYLAMKSYPQYYNEKKYYISRVKRIIPSYYVCLFLVYITDYIMYYAMGFTHREILTGPCGVRYLRYPFFLHMLIPSENFELWNNRSALWTMSAFAVFYILVPLIYKIANKFWKMVVLMCLTIYTTPLMVEFIGFYLKHIPEIDKVESFASKTPLAVLYCFLIGATIYFAKSEKKEVVFVVIIVLTSMLTIFKYEGMFAILLLISISIPTEVKNENRYKLIRFASGGSFYLYLIHPIAISVIHMIYSNVGLSLNKYLYGIILLLIALICSYSLYMIENLVRKKWLHGKTKNTTEVGV